MKRGSPPADVVSRETPWRRRLSQLSREYGLDDRQEARLVALLEFLAGAPHAPTTVVAPDHAVDVHVADSLSALRLSELAAPAVVADLGSGAGFPALVLAIARPAARVVAVESVARKAAFIGSAGEALGLPNLEVVASRVEEWRDGIEACDVVCARALSALGVVCEYAAPLLREGGVLVAWKGSVAPAEADAAQSACARLGLAEPERVDVEPYPASRGRGLYRVRKAAATPPGFPRRPGMAVKRPLA